MPPTLKEITDAIVQSYRADGGANHLAGQHPRNFPPRGISDIKHWESLVSDRVDRHLQSAH